MAGGSWKVAYADFVTAMMAFFLLMWIINMASDKTKQALAEFFTPQNWSQTSGGAQGKKSGNIVGVTGESKNIDQPVKTDKTYYAIAQKIKEELNAKNIAPETRGVSSDDNGVLLHVNADALFNLNSSELLPQASKVLDSVASIAREYNIFLVVRGHSEPTEQGIGNPPSRWALSSERATACVRYLVTQGGIKPELIRAVGYSDTRPLVPNTSIDNKSQNRRVEFLFHRPDALGGTIGY